MKQISFSERFRYSFDNVMSRGTWALILWLALVTVIVVFVISTLLLVTGNGIPAEGTEDPSLFQTVWTSLMHTIDAGTIAGDSTSNPFYLVMMIFATVAGLFIVSILIGIITSGIEARLEDLRKGRSFVVESGHTVILGWAPEVFSVISELVLANENRRGACIVILADKDKVEMEDEIYTRIEDLKTTRIVCRTGSPFDINDLYIVNADSASSIIILGGESDDPDVHVIKTILALTNNPQRNNKHYHIVAEIRDPDNLEVAQMIAPNELTVLPVGELIARVAVQTCLQSGLSVVYTELLDYQGSEIYFQDASHLVGKTYGEVLFMYETSTVIGIGFADGSVNVNPPMDTRLQEGDKIIVIAEDDDLIIVSGKTSYDVQTSTIALKDAQAPRQKNILVLGWNQRGLMMIRELESYVPEGSNMLIVSDFPDLEVLIAQEYPDLKNLRVIVQQGSTTNRRQLDELQPANYDHIITLSYMDTLAPQEADARTLMTLLHLRDISLKKGKKFSIVSEMLDVRNRELAEITRADDFIVSNSIISLMISQVSQNVALMAVFNELFSSQGSEIYLKPIGDYLTLGAPVSVYTLFEAARQRGETVIGYRIASLAQDSGKMYGVVINPNKADKVSFSAEDKIIVLSERG